MKTLVLILFALVTVTLVNAQTASRDSVLVICKKEAISTLTNAIEKEFGDPTESKKKAVKEAKRANFEAKINYLNARLEKDLPSTSLSVDNYSKAVFAEYRKSLPELKEDFYERATKRIETLK
ncbi:MAG: hypothetical protein WDO14_19290 [Bacteroidota bacterium]